ncbi:hypothetical protein [Halobellus captivus]|uniref:hypothetical protein n=1 Tax=Halobellus captivus TaxID=2592614 RepID=UPI0011A6AEDF|nr:hypothetical protein [Halobellus captivus]
MTALATEIALKVGYGFVFLLFWQWSAERHKRADLETDLCGAIYRGQVTTRDLRRSTKHKSIRRALEKQSPEDRERFNNTQRHRRGGR